MKIVSLLMLLVMSAGIEKAFAQEQVFFYNGDHSIRFGGTLSLPRDADKFNTVVLVSGTGMQNRKGIMAGHPIFEEIAAYCNAHGIAVLRTDDRGTDSTTGRYDTSTTFDFAMDALAAVAYLKTRKDIKGKIGLMGHSEGGAAACIAASVSHDVDFVVSLAGLAAPGLDALIAQNEAIVASTPDVSPLKQQRLNAINKLLFQIAYDNSYSPDSILIKSITDAYARWRVHDDSVMSGNIDNRERIVYPAERYAYQTTGKWYRFQVRYHPKDYFPLIRVPVLAVYGDKDIMVPPATHMPAFKEYITYRKGALLDTMLIKNMNHLLQHCTTCLPTEYYLPGQKTLEEMLDKVTSWIKNLK